MIRRTFVAEDEVEAAAMEQARAMVRQLKQLADATPDGHVLAVVEEAAVDRGRRFVRDRLQDVLNAQAAGLEKKGGADGVAPVAGHDVTRDGPSVAS
jgi:acyl-CoA reductase-like NAD-dependent aldehyde dehydrogenase